MLNELLGNRPATRPPLVLDTANDTLVVEGNDELSDVCDDAVERDNSLENVDDDGTSAAVAAVEISSEPSSSRATTPVSSLGNKGKKEREQNERLLRILFLK